MQKKDFIRIAAGLWTLLALTSCGGDKAGGTGEFATVFAVAGTTSGQLDADVATWVDENGASAQPCVAGSFISTAPDTVNYTITSTAYNQPNTGSTTSVTASPLAINRITLTLTPADTVSPVLPARFQVQFPSATAPLIVPNNTSTIPVRIVDHDLKSFFLTALGAGSISCSDNFIYSYRAVVSFELLEVTTNRVSTVTAPGFLLVRFSDYVDE